MCVLAERVKLIPMQSFFSTQFVRLTESGKMEVSATAWLLAAVAIPLTLLTILSWWSCAYGAPAPPTPTLISGALRKLLPLQKFRRARRVLDLESGEKCSSGQESSPSPSGPFSGSLPLNEERISL